jgi:GDPmannose 4,6-dehydratase
VAGRRRRALITGISGQDGSYLAELLVREGYDVTGTVRPPAARALPNLVRVRDHVTLVEAELLESSSLRRAVEASRPDELYHLAAPSFVPASWRDPTETIAAIAVATATLIAAAHETDPATRVWVAASSEVFGDAGESPQHERSPMRPKTPYGVAKLATHGLAGAMRERHGMFVCSGLVYNHESPRRPERFLARKVSRAAATIALGREREVTLGELRAVRDWSHAADCVQAARLALAHDAPDDYVVASGVGRTVDELVRVAFGHVGLDPADHVRIDPRLVRPIEPTALIGDAGRARRVLGWRPEHTFEETIAEMVEADLARLRR